LDVTPQTVKIWYFAYKFVSTVGNSYISAVDQDNVDEIWFAER